MANRTVKVSGKDMQAVDVDFEIGREEWNEYRLLDGGKLRVKTTVTNICRVLDQDGKPMMNEATGDPMYIISHKTDVTYRN